MIVDTSVILAMLLKEKECDRFKASLAGALMTAMSAASFVELQAVLTRRFGGVLDDDADALFALHQIAIAPVTAEQATIARDAYRRYGIGTGHPARLNFGDCFAYALSRSTGEPLLFKGDDFTRTDVAVAAC